jgi:hypothetical protein
VFVEAVTEEHDAAGLRALPLSSSPEMNNKRPDAWFPSITNYDLALIRWLMTATSELAEACGEAGDAAHWRGLLREFSSLSVGADGGLLVTRGYPLNYSHRHFSHLMAIHPLGLVDVSQGPGALRIVRASLRGLADKGTDSWNGYSFAWLSSMAARARRREGGERVRDLRVGFHVAQQLSLHRRSVGQGLQ